MAQFDTLTKLAIVLLSSVFHILLWVEYTHRLFKYVRVTHVRLKLATGLVPIPVLPTLEYGSKHKVSYQSTAPYNVHLKASLRMVNYFFFTL